MAEYEFSEVSAINTNEAMGCLSKHCLWVEPPLSSSSAVGRSSTSTISL